MSEQASMIKLIGKMDGISFYKRAGKYVARKASGPSKARIMNDPKFARTRENLTEFAGMAKATAAFVRVFHPVKDMHSGEFRGRVSKVMRRIAKQSTGVRGQRSILISKHRELMQNMELNADQTFSSVVNIPFTTIQNSGRTKATFSISALHMNMAINAPSKATHFKLVQLMGVVSDVIYNEDLNTYMAAAALNNLFSELSSTDYIPVRGSEPAPLMLETMFDRDTILSDNVSVLQCVGIIFFEEIGTAYYPLNFGKAMKIVNVF